MRMISLLLCMLYLVSCASQTSECIVFNDAQTGYSGVKQGDKVLIPAKYTKIIGIESNGGTIAFSSKDVEFEHLIPALRCNTWYRVDRDGKERFEALFHDNGPDYYCNGLARFVSADCQIGFHDVQGNVVIEPKYHWATPFGPIDAHQEAHQGRTNPHPREVTKGYSFVCIGCFQKPRKNEKFFPALPYGNKSMVSQGCDCDVALCGGQWGVIDLTGQTVIPIEHQSMRDVEKAFRQYKERRDKRG